MLFYTYQVHVLNLISLGATTFLRVNQNKKNKQVEVLNLISLGATTFLRVKDSLKMQLLIENPSLITSPKLQNLAFWVSQAFVFLLCDFYHLHISSSHIYVLHL